MSTAYRTYDVFTDVPFTGNPLAVFPDADGLSDSLMQAIAREFNLSETCFIIPISSLQAPDGVNLPDGCEGEGQHAPRLSFGASSMPKADFAVRIFTPTGEQKFAGHPMVGAALHLAESGRLGKLKDGDVRRMMCLAGPVDVRFHVGADGRVRMAEVSTPQAPVFEDAGLDRKVLAEMLSLDEADIVGAGKASVDSLGPSFAWCGSPCLLVPLRDEIALGRVLVRDSVRQRAIEERLTYSHTRAECVTSKLYCYVLQLDGSVRARLFPSPCGGIREDAATGSAAASLAAFLAVRLRAETPGRHEWVVRQGMEMGRPSVLYAAADVGPNGHVTRSYVAGTAVMVSYGSLRL